MSVMKTIQQIIFFTNTQKILAFLLEDPDKSYYDREVSRLTGVSQAGTNFALRDLALSGLVVRKKEGRMYFYKILFNNVLIKYFKIVQNIAFLEPVINALRNHSLRIVLYGSAANGTNTLESDIDLFILTRVKDEVQNIIFDYRKQKYIQSVVMVPNEYIKLKINNALFYNEIEQGIELWNEK
ncbi:MAG: hypothetical protein GF384_04910 [Elusimicrobia bacterium]|nr:hypothetical protein [Elusimicrobiota bacterium]